MNDLSSETKELFEQIAYGLSLEFREKWKHRYGTHLILIFQERILNCLETQKPIAKETLLQTMCRKHKYNQSIIEDFFSEIDIGLYKPLIK